MANVIEEDGQRFADPESLEAQIGEYAKLKKTMEFMETRQRELREKLFKALDEEGFEDDRGNILLDLDAPIEGIIRVEKQRRTSRKLDEQAAEAIIEANNLGDEVYKTVRMIDEDALMAMLYQDRITEAELDEMFPISTTWALTTKKK